jgi:hypothetical protein
MESMQWEIPGQLARCHRPGYPDKRVGLDDVGFMSSDDNPRKIRNAGKKHEQTEYTALPRF